MAHYALIDENNKVVQVITGVNENELIEGKSPEKWYGEFHNLTCKRTSYNTKGNKHSNGGEPYRGNYAGIGFVYDLVFDVFIPPQPFPSWKLNYQTFTWEAPIEKPEKIAGFKWSWSEFNQEWIQVEDKQINNN